MSQTEHAGTEIVSASWAAQRLGLPLRTLLYRAKQGHIPTLAKLEGRTGAYLFDRAAIEELAQAEPVAR